MSQTNKIPEGLRIDSLGFYRFSYFGVTDLMFFRELLITTPLTYLSHPSLEARRSGPNFIATWGDEQYLINNEMSTRMISISSSGIVTVHELTPVPMKNLNYKWELVKHLILVRDNS